MSIFDHCTLRPFYSNPNSTFSIAVIHVVGINDNKQLLNNVVFSPPAFIAEVPKYINTIIIAAVRASLNNAYIVRIRPKIA